jgi:hypothetical protein
VFRNTRIRYRLLAVGLGLGVFAAPTTALAGGYSGQALRALNAKGEAMNQRYGGKDGLSQQAYNAVVAKGQAMNQRYGGKDDLSQQAYNAVVARGEAMNRRYGASSTLDGRSPDTKSAAALAHEPVVTNTKTGFQWDDFGIGTGVALAALLLLALSLRILPNRQGRKPESVTTA